MENASFIDYSEYIYINNHKDNKKYTFKDQLNFFENKHKKYNIIFEDFKKDFKFLFPKRFQMKLKVIYGYI